MHCRVLVQPERPVRPNASEGVGVTSCGRKRNESACVYISKGGVITRKFKIFGNWKKVKGDSGSYQFYNFMVHLGPVLDDQVPLEKKSNTADVQKTPHLALCLQSPSKPDNSLEEDKYGPSGWYQ